MLHINVVIHWQLSNRVAADQYHLTVSQAQLLTHRGRAFFEVIHWQVTSFQMVVGSSFIVLKFIGNKLLCLCAALFKFWFQTDFGGEDSASSYRHGKQFLLTMVTRQSRSRSNFYALIGQNLTGEFVQKTYAASWKLFTLIAEAGPVLCQLLMFLTVFFHWMYKYSCYPSSTGCTNTAAIKSRLLFMAVCLSGFWLRNAALVKVGNPIFDDIVFVFHFAWCVKGLKGLKRFWRYLIAFRSCISNGKPE